MKIEITNENQQLIPADLAWHYRILPAEINDVKLVFYWDDSEDMESCKEELMALFGKEVLLLPHDSISINRALGTYYRNSNDNKEQLRFEAKSDFLDRLIQEANHIGSSDIHVEIYDDVARVRFRIDGHLIQKYIIDKKDYPELVNKIKIRANLDISEKRLPQDGRIQYHTFDIRVSILPTLFGEKIVLRILGHDASSLNIDKIGFSEWEKKVYLEGIRKPNGIVLISGPTGSGKTTTLYSTLKLLNSEKRNIVTVEDPVEYTLEGVNQVQLKESIGLTFSTALRSFLRQDPDVIMLGEIRDGETAQMAIRAALTGHLVLSTIHTNSAWGTISRLIDMGVPPFLLANTINISVAQRLVRKLCNCKIEAKLRGEDWPYRDSFHKPQFHMIANGCSDCHYTGYKNRVAIYEVIPIDQALSLNIKQNDFSIDSILRDKGIQKIPERAYELLIQGVTSIDEVYPLLTEF